MLFANRYPNFGKYLMGMFFLQYSFYQSELEFSDLDKKMSKTRPFLLKSLELPISIA